MSHDSIAQDSVSPDFLTLYKLIILYMINRAAFPITRAQVADFILEQGYMDFFTMQKVFAELLDSGLLSSKTVRNRTHLAITDEGRETLYYFQSRLNSSTKDRINNFFRENEMEMRNEVSILSDYYRSTSGEYEAHLTAKERGVCLVDITLSVPDEKTAVSICDNWQKKNQTVYQHLIEQLF
ncbi:MAG: DUF4364 family protein [Roseburia sp.]|nr:DUF4364 family protein [Ruminococcus sp.]MCM1155075.1 DUF4364 family protein [Roseburia sp.]MCM1242886.1 DUF4364 family protein [Roseburia sp.]